MSDKPYLIETVGLDVVDGSHRRHLGAKVRVLSQTDESPVLAVVERCLQAEAVVDRKGEPVIIETPEGELAAAYTFQAMGAIRALELLGKHLQMFNETVNHDHKPEPEHHIITAAEINAEIEEMFRGPSFSRAHQEH